jgi:hypothetical protein
VMTGFVVPVPEIQTQPLLWIDETRIVGARMSVACAVAATSQRSDMSAEPRRARFPQKEHPFISCNCRA